MTLPENRQPLTGEDLAKLHPSTWQAECKQLRLKLAEAESRASWAEMTKNRATEETKALRARVAELEAALTQISAGNSLSPITPETARYIARAALEAKP